eukprot:COSAG01_NODE_5836_length_4004_cov_14.173367_1_plen_1022_part_01
MSSARGFVGLLLVRLLSVDAQAAPPNWEKIQSLTASDSQNNDHFGRGADISGDGAVAVVGAPDEDTGDSDKGKVYVFERAAVGSTWSQVKMLQGSGTDSQDHFGTVVKVSYDGTTIGVGAPDDDSKGSVFIFTQVSAQWTEQSKLTASDGANDDEFGYALDVAADGSTVIVGAYHDGNPSDAGSAYIFTRIGAAWTQDAKIRASDKASGDRFGQSVAITDDGQVAVVGAYKDDNPNDAGSAYIFERTGSSWSQTCKVRASDKASGDRFGRSVAIDGHTVVVGALRDDNPSDAGSTYVFTKGASWAAVTQTQKLRASNMGSDDRLGEGHNGVAVRGDTIVAGAPREDSGGSQAGAAYVWGRSAGSAFAQTWTLRGSAAGASAGNYFGYAIGIGTDIMIVGERDGEAASIFARQVTIGYTSFEEPTVTGSTGNAMKYIDTLSASTNHALINNPNQNPVTYAGCTSGSAELGFTTYYGRLTGGGATGLGGTGQVIGVIGDSTTGMTHLGGGVAPHGTQYYMLERTDGNWVYVKMEPVWVAGYTGVQMKAWLHVEATSWEHGTTSTTNGDYVKIWAINDTTAAEVFVLDTSNGDLDSFTGVTENQWQEHSTPLTGFTSTATMAFGIKATADDEEMWFDYFRIVRDGTALATNRCAVTCPGASTCTAHPCMAGQYTNTSTTACATCPAGFVTNTLSASGATSCTACAAGQYTNVSTVACITCPAGSVTNTLASAGGVNCIACGSGTYTASSTVACATCAAGSITEVGAGTGVVSSGATTCTACGPGQASSTSTVACATCQNPGSVANADFGADSGVSGFTYVTPTSWQGSAGGVVVVQSSNGAWGGLAAPSGTHFISIQFNGKWIQQEACGLAPGAWYNMTFQMTHRPGYGNDEAGIIQVDGSTVWRSPVPMPNSFTTYLAVFQANSNGTATIRIENDSPAGDKSIFIDDISLAMSGCSSGLFAAVGASACTTCAAGSVAEVGAGTGVVSSGATTCTACGSGTYTASSTVACATCAAGSITEVGAGT